MCIKVMSWKKCRVNGVNKRTEERSTWIFCLFFYVCVCGWRKESDVKEMVVVVVVVED